MTLWEVTAHTVRNAGLLCQSVIMCNYVTYFTTFVLVLEFVWLSGFIVVCIIFPFTLKSPNPLKICVLIFPSPWTCCYTSWFSVEFFSSFLIISNKQCCVDHVNRIITTVYWMINLYIYICIHTHTIWLHCHHIIQIASRVLNIMLTRYHNFPTAIIPTVRLHVHVRRLVEEGKLEV